MSSGYTDANSDPPYQSPSASTTAVNRRKDAQAVGQSLPFTTLDDGDSGDSPEGLTAILERGGAQLSIAEALLISGNGGGAVAWARQARATYLAVPPSPEAARCLLIEGRARQLDRDASAELCFRGALRECQAIRPVPSLLEAEIACDLILHLGEKSRWTAARSVYSQVRPFRVPPPDLALVEDDAESYASPVNQGTPTHPAAARVMALRRLAQCQAEVAIMAAELCLHPLDRDDHVAAAYGPEES